jgi:hypothetical protein
MKNDALRNFTVRFRDSALQRVEMKAKPFYGGRLSTGEAIRRLAEERLAQIEKREPGERETLLGVLRVWRSGRRLSIADLRFIANAANTAYRRCRRDFVSKELLLAQVNAFRQVAPLVAGRMSGSSGVPARRPFLGDSMLHTPALDGTVVEAIDAWIAGLSDLPSPGQAEYASRNLLALLRDASASDGPLLAQAMEPFLPALIQLAVRSHWYSERSALVDGERPLYRARPPDVTPLRTGRVSVTPIVRDHDFEISIELPDYNSAVAANNFVEVEDFTAVTRLAALGQYVRGEVFQWSKQPDDRNRLTLSTEHGSWLLEPEALASIDRCMDLLFREPSIIALVERLTFIYGRV